VSTALPWVLLFALATHVVAHVTIVVRFARAGERRRAVTAFLLPPLAPLWAWRAGMRATVAAWTGGLAIYALGVAAA
jgi:hypothetical protein